MCVEAGRWLVREEPGFDAATLLRALIADLSATVESLRGEKEEVARLLAEQIEKLRSQVEWLTRQLSSLSHSYLYV